MSTALTTLTNQLASRLNMGDGSQLIETLKATAFKGQVSDAQMTALMVVANQYGLNPWCREIYAFPDKNNGIVPVVGVDGWARIINDHPQFDGMEYEQDEEKCTCILYRKDRSHAIKVTEYMDECKRGTGPWQSHPRRMLRHKATIQCARLAFGFGGIYDQDEAERIVESVNIIDGSTGEVINKKTTPQSALSANAGDGFAEYETATLPLMQEAAKSGSKKLEEEFRNLPKSQHRAPFWTKHGAALKDAAATADFIVEPEEVTA